MSETEKPKMWTKEMAEMAQFKMYVLDRLSREDEREAKQEERWEQERRREKRMQIEDKDTEDENVKVQQIKREHETNSEVWEPNTISADGLNRLLHLLPRKESKPEELPLSTEVSSAPTAVYHPEGSKFTSAEDFSVPPDFFPTPMAVYHPERTEFTSTEDFSVSPGFFPTPMAVYHPDRSEFTSTEELSASGCFPTPTRTAAIPEQEQGSLTRRTYRTILRDTRFLCENLQLLWRKGIRDCGPFLDGMFGLLKSDYAKVKMYDKTDILSIFSKRNMSTLAKYWNCLVAALANFRQGLEPLKACFWAKKINAKRTWDFDLLKKLKAKQKKPENLHRAALLRRTEAVAAKATSPAFPYAVSGDMSPLTQRIRKQQRPKKRFFAGEAEGQDSAAEVPQPQAIIPAKRRLALDPSVDEDGAATNNIWCGDLAKLFEHDTVYLTRGPPDAGAAQQ